MDTDIRNHVGEHVTVLVGGHRLAGYLAAVDTDSGIIVIRGWRILMARVDAWTTTRRSPDE